MVSFKGKKKEGPLETGLPENMELLVHLKLLTVFALHEAEFRQRAKAGLFGIEEIIFDETTGESLGLSKGQKHGDLHWRVYTVRAQERFHLWWKYLISEYGENPCGGLMLLDKEARPIDDLLMPPIDILMTWHAYMLNPRNYLTDCIRANLSRLWCTPFPWKLIDSLINANFQYEAPKDHIAKWVAKTSIPWLNEDSENVTFRKCRFCQGDITIQISRPGKFRCDLWLKKKKKAGHTQKQNSRVDRKSFGSKKYSVESELEVFDLEPTVEAGQSGETSRITENDILISKPNDSSKEDGSNQIDNQHFPEEEQAVVADNDSSEDEETLCEETIEVGPETRDDSVYEQTNRVPVLCDRHATFICPFCKKPNSHADLTLGRFINDIDSISGKTPLLGATLRIVGTPAVQAETLKFFETALPTLRYLSSSINVEKKLRETVVVALNFDRDDMEWAIENVAGKRGNLLSQSFRDDIAQRRALINRVLSYYLDNFNSSDLSLSLYQAVVRQGSFTNKMNDFAWLRSPKINDILYQCILKYSRFVTLIASRSPADRKSVMVPTLDVDLAWHTHQLSPKSYYIYSLEKSNTFIDHDDKISDIVLDSSFQNTAKRYFKMYNERYTMCYCSYCLQMQIGSVAQLSIAKLIFGKKHFKKADAFIGELSHVSAHNVVYLPSYKSLRSRYPRSASFDKNPQNSYEASNYPYTPYYFNQIYGFTPSCDSSGMVDPDSKKNCAACVGFGKNTCGAGLIGGCVNDSTFLRADFRRNGAPYFIAVGAAAVAASGGSGSSGNYVDTSPSRDNCEGTSNCGGTSGSACATTSSACGSNCGSSCGSGGGGCGGGGS